MGFINGGSVRCLEVTAMFMRVVYFPCAIESSTVKEYKFPKQECFKIASAYRRKKYISFDESDFYIFYKGKVQLSLLNS